MTPFYLALPKISILINTWFFQAVSMRGIYNAEKCAICIPGLETGCCDLNSRLLEQLSLVGKGLPFNLNVIHSWLVSLKSR